MEAVNYTTRYEIAYDGPPVPPEIERQLLLSLQKQLDDLVQRVLCGPAWMTPTKDETLTVESLSSMLQPSERLWRPYLMAPWFQIPT